MPPIRTRIDWKHALGLDLADPGSDDSMLSLGRLHQAGVSAGAVAQSFPVALAVLAEQAGRKVMAAAVPLAAISGDLNLHRNIALSA
jgi:hypothetical protein